LGTRVAERLYLDFNLRVRATTHRAHTAARVARLPLEFVDCDLLDPDQVSKAVTGCDLVINCARDAGGDARQIREFYIQGTSNLLEASVRHKVKKFIHMSTAAVHQYGQREELINERSPLVQRRDPYLSGKIESEKIVLEYSRFFPVVILRPMLIYGPYSGNWVTQIIKRLQNHQTTIVGDKGLANLIYVDDLVDAILLAADQEAANGETFIINNDRERILWKDYVQKYCEMLGISPKVSPEGSLLIQRFGNALSMVRDSLGIARELASSAEALAVLAKVPLVLKLGEMTLKGQKRESVQSKLTGAVTVSKPDGKILSKYETISSEMYRVFTARATFSAEKARGMLGFQAETPLEEGIAASLEWARWALGVGTGWGIPEQTSDT
jgi:nucleoside-diphosphate-sugar epimerase